MPYTPTRDDFKKSACVRTEAKPTMCAPVATAPEPVPAFTFGRPGPLLTAPKAAPVAPSATYPVAAPGYECALARILFQCRKKYEEHGQLTAIWHFYLACDVGLDAANKYVLTLAAREGWIRQSKQLS